MGPRLAVFGRGWGLLPSCFVLCCGGSDRVTLGVLPEGAAGSGGASIAGAAGAGDVGVGGSGGASGGRVREGSPSIEGIDGAGGGGLAGLDGGSAADAAGGTAVGADGGVLGSGGAPGSGGTAGGASGEVTDAGGVAGTTGGGVAGAGAAGASSGGSAGAAGDVVVVNLEPTSLGLFAPPIDSSRYAVAGYDAATAVCVSIIWDYSNNGLELGRHCDDFGQYVSFPYVLVEMGPALGCASSWGYAGLQPSAASGCIDPVEGLVNVRLEVESEGVRYVVRAVNEPALIGL